MPFRNASYKFRSSETACPDPGEAHPGETEPDPSAERERILIVDDEVEVLAALRAALARAGYEVFAATSLAQALAVVRTQSLHLILSDVYLGDQDLGFELADAARTARPAIPVVLLTGRPTFDGAIEALRNRVAEIVVKPVDPETVLATCRRTILECRLTRRNEELEVQNRVLAAVLPRAIEAKDPTTSGHAERVVHYADTLAQRCGVNAADRACLRLAALLHDVGKIGVPDAILTKPGPLTTDEREVIQRHPKLGHDILTPLDEHDNVRRWVYQHHERWDGKGYPEGIEREAVALPGRILVLAEVYDALVERRSYKTAWEVPRIVALFREQAGRQFDPDLAHLVADGLEQMGGRFFGSRAGTLF